MPIVILVFPDFVELTGKQIKGLKTVLATIVLIHVTFFLHILLFQLWVTFFFFSGTKKIHITCIY